ncbi:hypothetical protein HMPREF9517_00940 [Enterococcus faecalis TX1341]|uniref:Uncharacterized protein n=1 Tax=Enterococcus faecalis RP2S-4 TaxID=1244145 RepID=A0ABC9TL84_ENTFL|nr:hypothetical protein HMPREF9509_00274 [Enterococcus faecalis TX0411]EFM71640.1 hypothetical protein HMPREF9505_00066 [Enterococcus faecalis TX0109]EFQ12381.1 hypothetical protein HMPREF9504_02072 [Enterococcus faecalis TX0102]EFT97767.1 hypothetical protein HMPREF9502_00853 [Enterococcus faecalis TX0031]EFU02705.1 hypothetical protein HMPREF9508_01484 [Enterococcus faecalis TX0312]EFU12472.1 hypothetical protein HMPREF9517_00940 [Enterococcus faecalis TX1341]EPH71429.1 hypothetical protein
MQFRKKSRLIQNKKAVASSQSIIREEATASNFYYPCTFAIFPCSM